MTYTVSSGTLNLTQLQLCPVVPYSLIGLTKMDTNVTEYLLPVFGPRGGATILKVGEQILTPHFLASGETKLTA